MVVKASARYVRMSPQKVRYVLDQVRNKPVVKAYEILNEMPKKASIIVTKLIQSAVDAAEKNKQLKAESLYISKITANQAGMMKRWRSMSMGRAGSIRKRLSHIEIQLDHSKHKGVK